MPRLQILHHKSYHPYNEKNKQRVREDEAKAAAEELQREQRAIDAESEARLAMLRRRAGSPEDDLPSTSTTRDSAETLLEKHRRDKARKERREKKESERSRLNFDFPSEARREESKGKGKGREDEEEGRGEEKESGSGWSRRDKFTTDGHVNFWADLEKNPTKAIAPPPPDPAKVKADQEADKLTMYLSRPDRETKPWYTDRDLKRVDEKAVGEEAEERRARDKRKDVRSKERHDPLTDINRLLSTKPVKSGHGTATGGSRWVTARVGSGSAGRSGGGQQTERERAMAMMAAKTGQKAGAKWDDTPSSVGATWSDDFEKQKDRASRFFSSSGGRMGGRSWAV